MQRPVSPLHQHRGAISKHALLAVVGLAVLIGLGLMLSGMGRQQLAGPASVDGQPQASLTFFCAAGIRQPVEAVAKAYLEEYGVRINLDYGGSNTLLSRIETARTGDLYLAADESYIKTAREKGLVAESIPLARMKPVIAVAEGNPKNIKTIEDLLRKDVRTVLGNPDQAAVGKRTRKLLKASGHWTRLESLVRETGTFQPTVPEVANTVKIGGADAAIIWNTTTKIVDGIDAVEVPELDRGEVLVTVGILKTASSATEALKFARYLAAKDRGLRKFKEFGFNPVQGDNWAEVPELTFFCGSVNRRAVEQAIKKFQVREGVQINTVYNGCGILTAQMKTISEKKLTGFPDTYMACDKYYMEVVDGLFQDAVEISDTEVVIAVPKGNPKGIQKLADLTQPGLRVAVGQPDQCTIGILTRQVLEAEKIHDEVMKNVVTRTATSALLIAPVTTGAADASLAYLTDTKSESEKVDVVRIPSEAAKAIQPLGIAKASRNKQLARRLMQAITRSRSSFEEAGFHWRLDDDAPGS
ncbi:MAG: molybdate ABC transporter substrate-binding protein [Planctomycetota bacterium]|nr:molybdate ABC transporter substrate-binding protein [Planctomycetota bacterium]